MKTMLVSRDAALHAEIAAQGAARIPALVLSSTRHSLRDAIERPGHDHPALLLVDASDGEWHEPDLLERLCRHYPGASVMLLAPAHGEELLLRAIRAGVREVLHLPLVHQHFHEALDRVSAASSVSALRDGKVLAFISCKGGSGATFISTNFSFALAALTDKKVLLLDLHGQFGDATLYVTDQKPVMTISDVCSQIARIDGAFLESCLVRVSPHFGILAAADDPAQAAELKPEHMDTLLRVARQHYDFVILDVARQIDALSLRALDSADGIYPVLQLALPDIRDARRLIDIFRSLGYPSDSIRLLVNRYEKGGKLRLQDLHSALGAPVLHTIPNDYVAVTDSVNQGVPVLQLARGSAVARSLAELVDIVTARRTTEAKGLFERLFGRTDVDA